MTDSVAVAVVHLERGVVGEAVGMDQRPAQVHELHEALLHPVDELLEVGHVLERRDDGGEVLLREALEVHRAPDRVLLVARGPPAR